MKFDIHQSVDKTEYFLDFLITRKTLKLLDDISNQFDHHYYKTFLLIENSHFLRVTRFFLVSSEKGNLIALIYTILVGCGWLTNFSLLFRFR